MYDRKPVTTAVGCRLCYSLCADTITGHDRWIVQSRSNTSLSCHCMHDCLTGCRLAYTWRRHTAVQIVHRINFSRFRRDVSMSTFALIYCFIIIGRYRFCMCVVSCVADLYSNIFIQSYHSSENTYRQYIWPKGYASHTSSRSRSQGLAFKAAYRRWQLRCRHCNLKAARCRASRSGLRGL